MRSSKACKCEIEILTETQFREMASNQEQKEQPLGYTTTSGIDLGVNNIVVTSEGWKSGNPRHLHRYSRQLRKNQRRFSRQRKGSHRWHRQRIRVANAHARVRNTARIGCTSSAQR
jgi:transposase